MSNQETMLRDSIALANLKARFECRGSYYEIDDEEEDDERAVADEIAESCYALADAFIRARGRA